MAEFASLKETPENNTCIDCARRGSTWASVNNSVFICLECSGKHRSLGVHISFVRSTTMDTWSEHQLKFMRTGGNPRFTSLLEQYSISSLDISFKYNTKAVEWYRKMLRAEVDGLDLPEPPSMEQGKEQVVYEKVLRNEEVKFISGGGAVVKDQNNTSKWFGNAWDKANDWAVQATGSIKNVNIIDNIKEKAEDVYVRTKRIVKRRRVERKDSLDGALEDIVAEGPLPK